jgi:hypothetical protein
MPRYDDDEDEERPRRRRRDEDDEDERPARSRRRDEDDEDDRPRRRRRDDDDEDDRPRRKPAKKKSNVGLIIGIIAGVLFLCCGGGGLTLYLLSDKVGGGRSTDERVSENNLKQIGLGIHMYHDRMAVLPNNSYAPDGRPLLSWRVHLLPYVEQEGLYRQFKLDESWDSPNNRRLLSQMPRVYTTAGTGGRAVEGRTFYRGFSHQGAIFERPGQAPRRAGNALSFADISDGLSRTIFVVEAGEAVEWTKPEDIDFGPGKPLPQLGAGRGKDKVLVLMGDGTTRYVRKELPPETWRGLVSYAGGELVNPDD